MAITGKGIALGVGGLAAAGVLWWAFSGPSPEQDRAEADAAMLAHRTALRASLEGRRAAFVRKADARFAPLGTCQAEAQTTAPSCSRRLYDNSLDKSLRFQRSEPPLRKYYYYPSVTVDASYTLKLDSTDQIGFYFGIEDPHVQYEYDAGTRKLSWFTDYDRNMRPIDARFFDQLRLTYNVRLSLNSRVNSFPALDRYPAVALIIMNRLLRDIQFTGDIRRCQTGRQQLKFGNFSFDCYPSEDSGTKAKFIDMRFKAVDLPASAGVPFLQ